MLTIDGIVFEDAPSKIEGAPYWVDLWADINGYKIGIQVKPTSYQSASTSLYTRGAKVSEEAGHKLFRRDFGGKVFVVTPQNGTIPYKQAQAIRQEINLLSKIPPKEQK